MPGSLVQYIVDGEGRRIGKSVNGALVKGWLYDGSPSANCGGRTWETPFIHDVSLVNGPDQAPSKRHGTRFRPGPSRNPRGIQGWTGIAVNATLELCAFSSLRSSSPP